jgi:hypothetical protein
MKQILGLLIFCIVLFFYLHIQYQLKTSDDLEIYDLEQTSKEKFEEVLDLRQPLLFPWNESAKIANDTNAPNLIKQFGSFDMKIRKVLCNDDDDLYTPLPLKATDKLFCQDKTASYFSEKNQEFLEETGLIKQFKLNDAFLRPSLMSSYSYDVLLGCKNAFTPFRYEINYRNFYLVTHGSVQIKMAPPHNKKHLHMENDYENMEFRSAINAWSPEPKFCSEFDKVKCMEFSLTPGKVLFIPPYWWYTIKFVEPLSTICGFFYKTYMNHLSILPHICMHYLQMQNIKKTTTSNNNSIMLSLNKEQPEQPEKQQEQGQQQEHIQRTKEETTLIDSLEQPKQEDVQ